MLCNNLALYIRKIKTYKFFMELICNILNLPLDFRFTYSWESNGMEVAIIDLNLLLIT